MKMMKKKAWVSMVATMACLLTAAPLWSQETAKKGTTVEDITKEVLTGPNDMSPEKILGPGGVGINTHKDILMSFGATVRFVPTTESDWDFGLSNEVPGYFNTVPVKQYAGAALNLANSVQGVYTSSVALNDAITANRSSGSVIAAFDNFATAYYNANTVAKTNPALTTRITSLAAAMDGIYQAAAAAPTDDVKAAIIKGAVTTANPALGGANLLQVSSSLAAGLSQQIGKNTTNTASDLSGSISYLTVLKATADSYKPYYLANNFLKTHSNESGSINDGYIRNETKIYFNAMAKDKKWSFYGALEYDHPIDTNTVDNRGGKSGGSSNFGLERLNASVELTEGLRLHGGWDIWGLDVIESASMVYGDDNPGFWIKGSYSPIDFSVAWIKLEENDFQNSATEHNNAADADRDLVAGYVDWKVMDGNKLRFFGAWDRIRNVPALDLTGYLASAASLADYAGIYGNNGVLGAKAKSPDTDAYTMGAYYLGKFNILEFMVEAAYKFGTADDTGLQGVNNGVSTIAYNDFDISAWAFAMDVAVELKDLVGWPSLKPHIGYMYTSGDDDPNDDTLSGWTGITSAQRFSGMWGGENTIIGDTNFVLGSALYGYIPEFYGNGTPVFTGGIQNFTGTGNGRGDNPGLGMMSAGITLRPLIFLIYRTNVNTFWWNEDFYVANMMSPITLTAAGLQKTPYTKVEAGYVGTEWDNEVTLALSKHMFVKGQFSFFFPGDAVEDVTRALTGGTETDEMATRLAMELIWNF